ncbi:GNAT family N-acetyltransferase [Cryomorphaceae bacterium]|nr:GNAT family N-acetyltransferase [Cryomorphaceae bacterium]
MPKPIFLENWWIKALLAEALCEVRWEKGGVQAYWPMESRSKVGLKILNTPDLAPYLGPWFDFPKDVGTAKRETYLKEGVEALMAQLPDHDVLLARLHPEFEYFLPFVWQGCQLSPRVTYRLPAELDLDGVTQGFRSNVKRNLKKAESAIQLRPGSTVDALWDLSLKTFDRQGEKPHFDRDDLHRIHKVCLEHHSVNLIEAVDDQGRVHSAAMFLKDAQRVYYYKGGSDPELRESEAFSAVLYEGIRWSRELGLEFDFEGSMIEPVERFFRSWGAQRTVYYELRRFRNSKVKGLYFLKNPDRF